DRLDVHAERAPGEARTESELGPAAVREADVRRIAVIRRPRRRPHEPSPHPRRRSGDVDLVVRVDGRALGPTPGRPANHGWFAHARLLTLSASTTISRYPVTP